jgi:ABC-2 type transport system ATP-binding protein
VITTHNVEEVEHILTDVIFIQDGKIALNSTMDDVEQRYTELMVSADRAQEARLLGPMNERQLFGKHIFLFRDKDRHALAPLGETRTPNVADLFVATMEGGKP